MLIFFLWGFIWALKETPRTTRAFSLPNPSIWNHFWASSILLEYEICSYLKFPRDLQKCQNITDGCLFLLGGLVSIHSHFCHTTSILVGFRFFFFLTMVYQKYSQTSLILIAKLFWIIRDQKYMHCASLCSLYSF